MDFKRVLGFSYAQSRFSRQRLDVVVVVAEGVGGMELGLALVPLKGILGGWQKRGLETTIHLRAKIPELNDSHVGGEEGVDRGELQIETIA